MYRPGVTIFDTTRLRLRPRAGSFSCTWPDETLLIEVWECSTF